MEIISRATRVDAQGAATINHDAVRFLFDLYDVPKAKQKGLYDKILIYEQVLAIHARRTA